MPSLVCHAWREDGMACRRREGFCAVSNAAPALCPLPVRPGVHPIKPLHRQQKERLNAHGIHLGAVASEFSSIPSPSSLRRLPNLMHTSRDVVQESYDFDDRNASSCGGNLRRQIPNNGESAVVAIEPVARLLLDRKLL